MALREQILLNHVQELSIRITNQDLNEWEGIESLTEILLHNTSITKLQLRCWIDSSCLINQLLKNNLYLQSINFYSSFNDDIGDQVVRWIADGLKCNRSLEEIRLNVKGDEGVRWIADALKSNCSLRLISLEETRIGDEGARWIADALKSNCSIQEIWL